MLNHYPYPEAAASELESINGDNGMRLRKSAAQAYQAMAAEAQAAGITLVPLSAFRSVQEQDEVFFGVKQERSQTVRERAGVSAPPGYSEHHTGYAIDIGDGSASGSNLSTDFENTEAFKWLVANAPKYSFELSFPKDNSQGVNYEPWHWRYVGDSASLEMFFKAKNK
jgi:zinc D-Ala-D-Ala carboxypeptidase